MSQPIRILALAGSTRRQALNKQLARAAAALAAGAGATVTWVDLADYPIPLYDGDLEDEHGQSPAALSLRALFGQHDALLIASPEYNGFFPPLIKNTFDWLSRPLDGEERHAAFKDKQVLLLAATRGSSGGGRGLQQLRALLDNLKARSYENQFLLPRANEAFDSDGQFVAAQERDRLDELVRGFVRHVESAARRPAALA